MICKIYTLRLNENEGCIIIENEAGEMIASSGCESSVPTLCTKFCQAWVSNPLPEVEIWEEGDINYAYTEEFGYLFTPQIENEEERYHSEDEMFEEETFEEWLIGNGLEITLPKSDLEELEDQWNSMNHLYGIVCEESEDEDDEPNAPTYQQYQACENQLYRMVDKLKNQLPEIPSEITTFTDMYGNVYDTLEQCEQGEQKITFQSTLNPNIPANWIENALQKEIPISPYSQAYLGNLEKEARNNEPMEYDTIEEILASKLRPIYDEVLELGEYNIKKFSHKLVKRKDFQPRVDFQLLVNSSSDIWNAGHLLGISEDPNNPTVKLGQDSVKNLILFFKLMSNPKFATRASFEIEKILNK